jgi:hypothetical protein
MTKEQWIRHAEEKTGLLRPSHENGAMAEDWKREVRIHQSINPKFPECAARRKTQRGNKQSRELRATYRDLGLRRVTGNLGGIYYE